MRSSPNSPRYDTDGNRSIRRAGIIAGAGLLLMSALAGFGYQVAVKGLVTQGNAAKTATDVMAHQGLFRFGVLSLILVVVIDVVVAWALYRVFKPAGERVGFRKSAVAQQSNICDPDPRPERRRTAFRSG